MKEFTEKLIGRLEEGIFSMDERMKYDSKTQKLLISQNNGIKYAIKVANELAEEYGKDINVTTNNGWIPCSERLPEVATCYLVTEEVTVNSKKQYVTDIRLFGTEDEWLCPSNRKVIAWQPLPQPYTEEQKELSTTWQQQAMNRFERVE